MKIINNYNLSQKFPFFEFDYLENHPWLLCLDYYPAEDILKVSSGMPEYIFVEDVLGLYYPIIVSSAVTSDDFRNFLHSSKTLRLYERVKKGFSMDSEGLGCLDGDATAAFDELQTTAYEQLKTEGTIGLDDIDLYRQ